MSQTSIDPVRSAVLSMDLQAGIVSIYARNDEGFVTRAASVLDRARARGLTVIHVRVSFRPGLPEVSDRNPLFGAIKRSTQHQQLFAGQVGAFHKTVAPQEGDIVVTKSRVSAFAGTDLELILRAKSIDTLVLFGIATSGVVLSTLLHASDADYRIFVVSDCCADSDPGLHSCLIEKFFPSRATVVTARQFAEMR